MNDNRLLSLRFRGYLLLLVKMQVFIALAFFLFSILANAHNIQLKAHSRECFHENLHREDKMTVSFQVGDREFGGSGNLDIDFWVRLRLPITHLLKTKFLRTN